MRLIVSPYFQRSSSETTSRTIIDVLFCDRLTQLDDDNAKNHLNWYPEVSMTARNHLDDQVIRGRADWCLAYGPKTSLQTTLVVLFVL